MPDDMPMVGRMARAMRAFLLGPDGPRYAGTNDDLSSVCVDGDVDLLRLAHAAIEALRVPTKAMTEAGEMEDDRTTSYVQAAECTEHWRAMIDAALAE